MKSPHREKFLRVYETALAGGRSTELADRLG